MSSRYAPRYPAMSSTGWCAPATSRRASAATGGSAAPLPSRTIRPGLQAVRQPDPFGHVGDERLSRHASAAPPASDRDTPLSTASSKWSEAACRPCRLQARRSSAVRRRLRAVDDLGLRRPARPMATTTTPGRPPARGRRLKDPGDVPADRRLPHPLAGTDDGERGNVRKGVRKSRG